jgi:DNA-directed RNA polymerase subunit beta'
VAGRIEFEELRTIDHKGTDGNVKTIVVGRSGEMRIVDEKTGIVIMNANIPYGSDLMVVDKTKVKKGDVICKWDPYNALIITEVKGKVKFDFMEAGITYREEMDEQTGYNRKVIIESRDKKKSPAIHIVDAKTKEVLREYSLPVSALLNVEEGDLVDAGVILVKIPRSSGKSGDITGGLPRVTELFDVVLPSSKAESLKSLFHKTGGLQQMEPLVFLGVQNNPRLTTEQLVATIEEKRIVNRRLGSKAACEGNDVRYPEVETVLRHCEKFEQLRTG